MPTTKAGHAPTGRPTAALNGTYGSVLAVAADSSVELTWSPVRFAPLGPIGREVSVKAQVSDVQMHAPLTGSQKGVEQFEGSRKRAGAEMVSRTSCGSASIVSVYGSPNGPLYSVRTTWMSHALP